MQEHTGKLVGLIIAITIIMGTLLIVVLDKKSEGNEEEVVKHTVTLEPIPSKPIPTVTHNGSPDLVPVALSGDVNLKQKVEFSVHESLRFRESVAIPEKRTCFGNDWTSASKYRYNIKATILSGSMTPDPEDDFVMYWQRCQDASKDVGCKPAVTIIVHKPKAGWVNDPGLTTNILRGFCRTGYEPIKENTYN